MPRRLGLLGLLLAMLAPANARAVEPEPGFVVSLPLAPTALSKLVAANAKTARFIVRTDKDSVDGYKPAVDALVARGIAPVFALVGDPAAPPVSPDAIAAYVAKTRDFVAAFKGKVAGWEVWNEEDAPLWWAGQPDPSGTSRNAAPYLKLLRAAAPVIHAAGEKVVLGALTGNDYLYLENLYAQGADTNGLFDFVAVHTDTACNNRTPYDLIRDTPGGRINMFKFLGYRSVYDVMSAHGDAAKRIWMTELGWSSNQGCDRGVNASANAGGVDEATQARYLTQAFHCLSMDRAIVTKAIVFRLFDDGTGTPDAGFGLVRPSGAEKPGFTAFSIFAHRGDSLGSEPCGDTVAPSARVVAPGLIGKAPDMSLPIAVSGADPQPGVGMAAINLGYFPVNAAGAPTGPEQKINAFHPVSGTPPSLDGSMNWDKQLRALAKGRYMLHAQSLDANLSAGDAYSKLEIRDPKDLPPRAARLRVRFTLRPPSVELLIYVQPGAFQQRGAVAAALRKSDARGKVQVRFFKKVKRKWKVAKKYSHNASREWRLRVRLPKGAWRYQVSFTGKPPFKSTKTKPRRFTMK